MKVKINKKEMYIDGYLKSNLDIAYRIAKEDWDCFFIIDGIEGSGKSVFTNQCASYLDPTYNIDRCCFTADEYIKAVKKAKRFQAVVFDEADVGLSSRRAMSKTNFALNSTIAQIRQKNLFGFIVCPSFYFIDRRIAIFRSRALIHVYHKQFKRGYFAFYDYTKKLRLYLKHKEYLSYGVRPNFVGRFTNNYVINKKVYLKKKLKSLEVKEEELIDKNKLYKDSIVKYLKKDKDWPYKEIIKSMNQYSKLEANKDTVYYILNEK